MDYATIIGLIAGTLTSISFLPQVFKIIKTKHTKDISLGMFVMLGTGIFLWLVYGILISSLPVILANIISFILALTIVIFKLKYK